MMVRDTVPFLFVAGALPIDFVNTEIALNGKPLDLLGGDADLRRWLAEAGLRASVSRRSLAEAKALRAHLRRTFLRLASGKRLGAADVAPINAALREGGGHLHLDVRRGRPDMKMEFAPRVSPRFLIARAAAEFLASADLSRIRQCEGKGCVLLF